MGRPTRDTEAFRDEPDSMSLHTTPDDFNYDDAPEISGLPPSYVDDAATARLPPRHLPPPSSRIDHNNWFQLSGNKPVVGEVQNLMDARYDSDPIYLEEGIKTMAKVAPTPLIYIIGSHQETVRKGDKKEKNTVVDFRIVLNLERYLRNNYDMQDTTWMGLRTVENGEKVLRGSFMKSRAPGFTKDLEVGVPKPQLNEWCHRYCASPSLLRIFRLERVVTGFDETLLKNRLEGLIRSANYRGHISITFPVENRAVDIYTSNRINQWRLKNWVCWIFYLTFLWIFTWPYLFFATKRYAVVKAEWPFSRTDATGRKTYTTVSEEQWFERWNIGIRRLVLDRYQGEAADEYLAGVIDRPEDPPMPGSIRTGHVGVDNAVGSLQQGLAIAKSIYRGNLLGGGQAGWGGDC
ncbi:hypothetical protein K432DRAFT_355238 [Lepidopterella palustris CBS 459.81]|uniref:Uncharacterized protein n=1 Tax=Lepidopterella palustris CBS 459.81 TaxID=1314670 RepID=A0A8E2E8P8_9PEZI|nr:hypothetical protein K432DRAFT_355238 [Lepidopterella palustris CBS 459.81]